MNYVAVRAVVYHKIVHRRIQSRDGTGRVGRSINIDLVSLIRAIAQEARELHCENKRDNQ